MAYEVIIKTPSGQVIETLTKGDIHYLYCGRFDRNYMPCVLQIPLKPGRDFANYTKDMLIEVWRETSNGLSLDGETAYFLRQKRIFRDRANRELIELVGYDSNYILDGRIIAYDAGSDEASKKDVANDLMKAVVNENFITATDTDRNLSSSYFTKQADDNTGGTVEFKASRQCVFTSLEGITDQSRAGGDWVTYDVFYNGSLPFEFRTYAGQRGADLTSQITLSVEAGNLAEPSLTYNWADEKTYAYMGGIGQESERLVGEAENSTAINQTVWSRREVISENFQATSTDTLDDLAAALLQENSGKIIFDGRIQQTKGMRYGVNWNYGDKLNVQYQGLEFECRVLGYTIEYGTNQNNETVDSISAVVRGEINE